MNETAFAIFAVFVGCIVGICLFGIHYLGFKAKHPYKPLPKPESFAGQTFTREEYLEWASDIRTHHEFSPEQKEECFRHLNHRWRCINNCEPPRPTIRINTMRGVR